MKILPPKTSAIEASGVRKGPPKGNRVRREKVSFSSVKVPKRPDRKPPSEVFEMLDSVIIKRDIPGTDFKKGMQGAVVGLYGTPLVAVELEIIDPAYIKDIDVEDIELVRRY